MKKLLTIFLIVFVAIAGILVLSQKTNKPQEEQSLQSKVDTIDSEYRNGTITREEANEQFCNLNVRSEAEQQNAVEAIREYANNPSLNVEYVCNNFSPNNPDKEPTEETYLAEGKYYFVEIANNTVARVQ